MAPGAPSFQADGVVGPAVLAAVDRADPGQFWQAFLATRMRFYGQVIVGDARKRGRTEDDALNAAGWLNRLAEFMEAWGEA